MANSPNPQNMAIHLTRVNRQTSHWTTMYQLFCTKWSNSFVRRIWIRQRHPCCSLCWNLQAAIMIFREPSINCGIGSASTSITTHSFIAQCVSGSWMPFTIDAPLVRTLIGSLILNWSYTPPLMNFDEWSNRISSWSSGILNRRIELSRMLWMVGLIDRSFVKYDSFLVSGNVYKQQTSIHPPVTILLSTDGKPMINSKATQTSIWPVSFANPIKNLPFEYSL